MTPEQAETTSQLASKIGEFARENCGGDVESALLALWQAAIIGHSSVNMYLGRNKQVSRKICVDTVRDMHDTLWDIGRPLVAAAVQPPQGNA